MARKNARLARSYAERRKLREGSGAGSLDGAKDYQSTPGQPLTKSRDLVQPGDPSLNNSTVANGPALGNARGSKSAAKLSSYDAGPATRKPPMPQQRANR